jgi:uncharacterized protein with HEPN domain
MPPRDVRAFLWDIHHACDLLTSAARERTIEEYAQDEWLRMGVERAFEILAEALTNVLRMPPLQREVEMVLAELPLPDEPE